MATALHVSTYSYKSLAMACLPLMGPGGSLVGLTFDATQAWPVYDWMGVAKAGLESANRYLALHLGDAGHPGQPGLGRPAAHDGGQVDPRLRAVRGRLGRAGAAGLGPHRPGAGRAGVLALLSDWFPATTGEIVHVDGGYHAIGA